VLQPDTELEIGATYELTDCNWGADGVSHPPNVAFILALYYAVPLCGDRSLSVIFFVADIF